MSIAFLCSCGKRWSVAAKLAGRRVRCRECDTVMTVPQGEPGSSNRSRCCADCGNTRTPDELEIVTTSVGDMPVCEACLAGKGKRGAADLAMVGFLVYALVVGVIVGLIDDSSLAGKVIPGILGGLGVILFLGWQRRSTLSARRDLHQDTRPFVLYLRSFRDETRDRRFRALLALLPQGNNMDTNEQNLAQAMIRLGPFVAVGRPGEALPTLGATRLYLDDDVWQDEVRRLMREASLVILRAADTDGLAWELEQVVELVDPRRLVVWSPCLGRYYKKFCGWANEVLPQGLPDKKSLYTAFRRDWQPVQLRFRPRLSLTPGAPILRTLEPVLRALKLSPSKGANDRLRERGSQSGWRPR